MNTQNAFTANMIRVLVLVTLFAAAIAVAQEPAPHFNARTTAGEKFTNDTVKGKVLLLQFWATWCPYCRDEQSTLDKIEREFAGQGLVVLAVNVGESKKTVKKYLEEHPRSCRIVLNDDTNLAAMFAAKSYPVYVVIDKDGNVAGTQKGAAGERGLRHLLRRAGLESD